MTAEYPTDGNLKPVNERILITGGLGYVGGRLADSLRNEFPSTALVLTTRNRSSAHLPDWAESFQIELLDLETAESIDRCLSLQPVDTIIHLAAMNENDSAGNPERALNVNTVGTLRLLKAAQAAGVRRFIYFSTIHVYGALSGRRITEESQTRPFHPYAYTHRAAEDIVTSFRRDFGMNTLVLRLSNAYGYPMDIGINRWTLLVNDLCRQIVTTGRIVLHSSGLQHRNFIALTDVCRAVNHLLSIETGRWRDGLLNIGAEMSISVLEMAQQIADIHATKYGVIRHPIQRPHLRQDINDQKQIHFSIEKLKATGFIPKNPMTREIEKHLELCERFKYGSYRR